MTPFGAIELVVADVDGTLTDGSMYYGENGEVLKRFTTYDGVAVAMLREIGIETALITAETSPIVTARAAKLRISKVVLGSVAKDRDLLDICNHFGVAPHLTAYLGDDIGDLPAMKLAGLSVAVANATREVKKLANVTLATRGGEGALRELAEMIVSSRSEVQ
jgi:3-deoxy-D-manno-octulosonate 8-phosphate phosphatase (KDO 8-P phosphatase)